MASFEFPPYYNFPPFFTRQINEDTWKKQRQLWSELFLSYFRHHKQYQVSVSEILQLPLCQNESLKRRLKENTLREILDYLAGNGNIEWQDEKTKTVCIILWKSPLEWANYLTDWVESNGLKGNIFTIYELINSEDYASLEFHKLEERILLKAISILEKKGKAQVFEVSGKSGVKFF